MKSQLEEVQAKTHILKQIFRDRVDFLEKQLVKLQSRSSEISKFIEELIKLTESAHDEYMRKERGWEKEKRELEEKVGKLEEKLKKLGEK